ncbi:MAG: hypothetical protein GY854_27210, partial [Deltaproteobacteria bacterium]|nr:hypothetical protein [Deltaproteobacteria bacterium]
KNKRLYVVVNCIAWIPINIYLFLLIYSLVKPGEYLFSEIFDSLLLWVDFHLSMLCLLYVAVSTFRFYLNKQRKLGEELGKNSYGVYVIHVIVMGAIALPMLGTAIPSLLKQLILVLSTYAASNLLVYLYRKFKPYSLIFGASAH